MSNCTCDTSMDGACPYCQVSARAACLDDHMDAMKDLIGRVIMYYGREVGGGPIATLDDYIHDMKPFATKDIDWSSEDWEMFAG